MTTSLASPSRVYGVLWTPDDTQGHPAWDTEENGVQWHLSCRPADGDNPGWWLYRNIMPMAFVVPARRDDTRMAMVIGSLYVAASRVG